MCKHLIFPVPTLLRNSSRCCSFPWFLKKVAAVSIRIHFGYLIGVFMVMGKKGIVLGSRFSVTA